MGYFTRIPVIAYVFVTFLVFVLLFRPRFSETTGTPSAAPSSVTPASNSIFDIADPYTPFDFSLGFPLKPIPRSSDETPSVLVLVTTTASEWKMREAVRISWANTTSKAVRVEFLMGRPTAQQQQEMAVENAKYNDLVIADVEEGYYSLAGKTMAMMLYKDKYYSDTKCLVKSDIDNVLLLQNYETLCERTEAPMILGKCDVPRTVFRNGSKWSVPEFVFPEPLYPVYCSTGTYVLVGKTVPQLLIREGMHGMFANSYNFRKLPEDVIFTGILPEKAGILRRHVPGVSFVAVPEFFCSDGKKKTYSVHLLVEKDPVKHFNKLMKIEGTTCHSWDPFGMLS